MPWTLVGRLGSTTRRILFLSFYSYARFVPLIGTIQSKLVLLMKLIVVLRAIHGIGGVVLHLKIAREKEKSVEFVPFFMGNYCFDIIRLERGDISYS